ncbi:MAG: hypothetical protein NTY67_06205 [Cyanobacteria bacterium]|nr:hypothetical protein [Cyanobacteriota bacterium]
MRQHPISPVTEPTQYRAIGVVRGQYIPADPEQPTRGMIRTADGSEIEAVVLGRLLTLMRRHLDLAESHLWVVYPRTREQNHLHLQMVGVWEPSTLDQDHQPLPDGAVQDGAAQDGSDAELAGEPATATEASGLETEPTAGADLIGEAPQAVVSEQEPQSDVAAPAEDTPAEDTPAADSAGADALPEGDDYFSVRGELIYTRPESSDLVIKVRQQPLKLQLRGEIPLEHLRHFVSLDLRRQGQQLNLESLEVLEPVAQRGNRGGKGRRGGPEKGGGGGAGGGRSRPSDAGPSRPAAHGKAVSRPGR